MGGQITMAIETISPILPLVRAGKIKALGVTASKRSNELPDVPTIAESGYPGFDVTNWYGVLAPAGTPHKTIARLNHEITRIVRLPEVKERLISAGLEVVDSTPEEYAVFRKSDLAKWAKIIRDTNLRYE
jgi:tripartite-type tricarboxylate transporter receptor subunit TctC